MRAVLMSAVALVVSFLGNQASAADAYQSFKTAIYVTVHSTREMADPKVREQQYRRVAGQLRFDKVYIETFRSGVFADESTLEGIKKFFKSKGIATSGGITLAKNEGSGQFAAFDYENPQDRAECQRAVELAARHFDEVILDDFFFYNSKSDADIAAKGNRSWTQYRLEKMREVAADLVLKPARAANPHVKVTIKYPNWYEHFQALGFDLDQEAKAFDFIYTGTETRDPEITDQLLQQYESYEVYRYYSNIRPNGGDRGGWVDTYDTRYVDRYPEQLWDTLFAKAPEITLFNWVAMASMDAVAPGNRDAWSHQQTSFDWDAMTHSVKPGTPGAGPGWGSVAGWSLDKVDKVVGHLGKPIGVASYKPFQSSGEDYLQNYLGTIGVPIEMTPNFPTEASTVLLTEAAAHDPDIVTRIEHQLAAGKKVVITSGFLQAMQGHGIGDVVELNYTGNKVPVHTYFGNFGPGGGKSLNDAGKAASDILFTDIRFFTNDTWPLIRGVASDYGVPILLMNRYSKGVLYVLNIPDDPGDLYQLPQAMTKAIRDYLLADLPVGLDAPDHISLFEYDNGTFVVESFRPEPVTLDVTVSGAHTKIRDIASGESISAQSATPTPASKAPGDSARYHFKIQVPAHSYRAFVTE
jgi:hypothetical protein